MGRHRIPDDEKKIPITISISKKLLNELNKKGINRSKLFEELLIKYLKNNPDKDVLDIFHTVYDGRYKLNYAEEEAYNTHLYEEGQVYLAVVYEERVDKNEHINDAYIVLMSEKEQYEKGKEILAHRYMPRFRFDEDYAIPYSAYEHVRNGEQKRAAIAIMKNNTFEQDGKKYMHTWSNEVVMVKVVGKHKNGMLLTELYQYC